MSNSNSISSNIFFPTEWKDYELIDFGYSKKLERFGNFTFVRPDSQAIAEPCLDKKIWERADGILIFLMMKKKVAGNYQKMCLNFGM